MTYNCSIKSYFFQTKIFDVPINFVIILFCCCQKRPKTEFQPNKMKLHPKKCVYNRFPKSNKMPFLLSLLQELRNMQKIME